MESIIKKFKFSGGSRFTLKEYETNFSGTYEKQQAETTLAGLSKQISELQTTFFAANQYSLLIIFQGMDASGKDGAIAHTLSGINPQGVNVHSFKQPDGIELQHDFLWRHNLALPEKGKIGIHNRSHYENVLICKVHPEILVKQAINGITAKQQPDHQFWDKRYESIRGFEKHLVTNGTIIIKFYLHLSKSEQKKRFLKRIEEPGKNWKFSSADINERQYWAAYIEAYEKAINETATPVAPWFIIPADKKWFTRIAISTIILDTLQNLKLTYPVLSAEESLKLADAAKQLKNEPPEE